MNAISEKARLAAMQFEAKKNGLQQVQSGDWKLSLTVSPTDVPSALLSAAMGTRYVVAIVEVDDNEQPVGPDKKKDPHRLSRQAAMLCDDQKFQAFLSLEYPESWRCPAAVQPTDFMLRAALCVRQICQVQSRSEFDTDPVAGARWRDLKGEFEKWKIT